MIGNLADFMLLIEAYLHYLRKNGIQFQKNGFPVFRTEVFLNEWPDLIVPYDFRGSRIVTIPRKTLLCFYCSDSRIYPRLESVLEDISEYRRFMGTVAVDVTVTKDMDEEWQDATMLFHQLFMAVLAVNGVKVVPNLRTGKASTIKNFEGIPKNVMWSAGFLGCAKEQKQDFRFIETVLSVLPSKLIVYGSEDQNAVDKLQRMGILYRVFDDYHKLCKKRLQFG